jgi:acyl-CoA-binding protein
MAAVFVAERKPVEKILDGGKPGAFEVRGAARSDALQELQGRLQKGV